jgi:hypothetical protein
VFKLIYNYECKIDSGHVFYWFMTAEKWKEKYFPTNFNSRLYDLMMTWAPNKKEVTPKKIYFQLISN